MTIRNKIYSRYLSIPKKARSWITYKIEKLYYFVKSTHLEVLALV